MDWDSFDAAARQAFKAILFPYFSSPALSTVPETASRIVLAVDSAISSGDEQVEGRLEQMLWILWADIRKLCQSGGQEERAVELVAALKKADPSDECFAASLDLWGEHFRWHCLPILNPSITEDVHSA